MAKSRKQMEDYGSIERKQVLRAKMPQIIDYVNKVVAAENHFPFAFCLNLVDVAGTNGREFDIQIMSMMSNAFIQEFTPAQQQMVFQYINNHPLEDDDCYIFVLSSSGIYINSYRDMLIDHEIQSLVKSRPDIHVLDLSNVNLSGKE